MATAKQSPITTIAIGADSVNVSLSHVLFNELSAFLVVSDEVMPAASGAVFNAAADRIDDNAIAIGFGPSIFDPAYFPNFADLRPSVLTHILSSLKWFLISTNRASWPNATRVASASGERSVAMSDSYNGGVA